MSTRTVFGISVVALLVSFALGFLPGPWALLAFSPLLVFVPIAYLMFKPARKPR